MGWMEEKEEKNVMCHMSGVTCHMSHVADHLSPVTCHLSLTPTATATDPPPASSPIMHSRLVRKDQKNPKKFKTKKIIKTKKNRTA